MRYISYTDYIDIKAVKQIRCLVLKKLVKMKNEIFYSNVVF